MGEINRIAVLTVNRNTSTTLAHLLFSLFRIVGRDQLARIVVIDQASTDQSRQLLFGLERAGLVSLIFNQDNAGHGPGLNQGLDYLCATRHLSQTAAGQFDFVLIVDSDSIVLRQDALPRCIAALTAAEGAMLGEFQYDALPEGYAHPSCLLIDWHRFDLRRDRFEASGAPAVSVHHSLREAEERIVDFPLFSDHFVLHVGRSTRRSGAGHTAGRHAEGAVDEYPPHYHGVPAGVELHGAFLRVFDREVGQLSPESLKTACLQDGTLCQPTDLNLAGESV